MLTTVYSCLAVKFEDVIPKEKMLKSSSDPNVSSTHATGDPWQLSNDVVVPDVPYLSILIK